MEQQKKGWKVSEMHYETKLNLDTYGIKQGESEINIRTHEFAILAILAALVLIGITYHYDILELLKDLGFKVPWSWIAIGVFYALLIILAISECWTVYGTEFYVRQEQPRNERVEESKPEPEGK